jgi:hypothetical protein
VTRGLRLLVACAVACATAGADRASAQDAASYRGWIEEMKASPQGPFGGIGWFCNDGTVRGPRAGCSGHGDGIQHGTWSERTERLRSDGYLVANLLAELEPGQFTGDQADLELLRAVVLERFLMGWDQGWISRGAFTYRGAYQIEDEENGARRVVLGLLADPRWREPSRYALLRETVRLLPIHVDTVNAAQVRADALSLASADPGFMRLRAKIHNAPDAADADRVREYAADHGRSSGRYEALAASIDRLYAPDGALAAVQRLAPIIAKPAVEKQLRDKSVEFQEEVKPGRKLAAAARLLRLLRETFPTIDDPNVALETLLTSLALEREVWSAGNVALSKIDGLTRRTRLWLLGYVSDSLYGIGLLSMRQLEGIEQSIIGIENKRPKLREYRDTVRYLSRTPEWGGRSLEFHFGRTIERWGTALDPAARQYVPDRLRGSPMLTYSLILDHVVADVNGLAGIEHEVLGDKVGAGVRALNPGLARGTLRRLEGGQSALSLDPGGIYLLPDTTPDLAPVAGILTQGEGSSLSHVQLLARNLGIPNVVIGDAVLPRVEKAKGRRVVLAVSPGGVVQLAPDGSRWTAVFGAEAKSTKGDNRIVIEPAKLDLEATDFLSFKDLRAWDSGRVVGPKGANLGELRFSFGDQVPNGFVIPFGTFRRLLDQPLEPGGPTVWTWMKQSYASIGRASGEEKKQRIAAYLERLRGWIRSVDPGPSFEGQLRWNLEQHFGPNDGVFVRSDTNVEDLPGFTGAGLNQTIPNVVGYDAILQAIRDVWASPFTERAYSWRQAHMDKPEYVFPAVVVQRAFASEKSGVLVTADVERGDQAYLSVAVNEGVGGAVDGQAAESLRIDMGTGQVTVLAQAAASERVVLSPDGGVVRKPASGAERILENGEIKQLMQFAKQVPARFPSLRTMTGDSVPADIEFAFKNGKLALLQIRPFNESRRAQKSQYLAQLDAPFATRGDVEVALTEVPGAAPTVPAASTASVDGKESERR